MANNYFSALAVRLRQNGIRSFRISPGSVYPLSRLHARPTKTRIRIATMSVMTCDAVSFILKNSAHYPVSPTGPDTGMV